MCRPPRKNAARTRSSAICKNIRSKVLTACTIVKLHSYAISSKIPEIVDAWRLDLQGKGRSKLASSIASPAEHGDLFEEGWAEAVKRETNGDSGEVA